MDVSVCFVRSVKKKMLPDSFTSSNCDVSHLSENGIAKTPVSNVLREAKLQMKALALEERKLEKLARDENRLMKLAIREEKKQKRDGR